MARRVMGICMALLLASACASTKLSQVYKQPDPGPRPTKVLVVAVVPQETSRRALEGEFTKKLKAHGVEAAASAEFVPEGKALDRAKVEELVRQNGFDGVLVSRYTGTKESTTYSPGMYTGFYGYYGFAYGAAYSPGYTYTNETVKAETMLFRVDGGEGKMQWGALSESFNPSSPYEVIQEVTDAVVKQMANDKVL